jgi:peptide/nickel transport system substrate-binding protein
MSGGNVVPVALGAEMGEDGSVEPAHPVVRVRASHAVRDVLERLLRRHGRTGHGPHRTPALAAAALLVPAVLAGAALAPGGSARAAGGEDPVRFTVGILNEVDSFNPFLGIEAESYEMWALTYDYMITYSMEDMSPEPGLATAWETSDDGLTWTFDIREGVMWSDGEPLTAADIAYTYNRILDGGPESSTWGSYLTSVTTIEAPDDTHVVLTLEKPNAVLPLLPIPIVPEHVWQSVDEKAVKSYAAEPTDGQTVVGSGPFRLVEGTAGGSTYRFEKNPDYWQGESHVDEVVFRVYKSEDPAVQALIKGEVDFVEGITPLQVRALEGKEGITAQSGDSPGFDEIALNTGAVDTESGDPLGDGHEALKDPAFRYALNFALDRDQIIEKAYQGAGQPGSVLIPPGYKDWHWEPPEEDAFTFDIDKADQLLEEAGYARGSDGKRLMPDGSEFGKLRLFARSESTVSTTVMDFFAEWLGELGIDSEITVMESNKLTNVILDGEFDAFEWGWYVEPDPDSMLSYMTCDQRGGWSDSWYCNEEYDALYSEQNGATDVTVRQEAVSRMQEILYYDSPYLITAYTSISEAYRSDRWACFQPQPDPGGILLIQYGVKNYLSLRPADEAGDCDGVESALGAGQKAGGGGGDSDEGGGSPALMIGGGVLLGALVLGGGAWAMRRRASTADRE